MLRTIGDLLFGGSCFLCRGTADALLCAPCDAELPRLGPERCPRCALASPAGALCGRCLAQAPAFDATCAALAYRFPADALVQALKFHGELALAPFLGDLLAPCIPAGDADYLVPVPLSRERLRSRGYNQALEIARGVARRAGVRLAPELCERTRDTPAQTDLPLAERAKNVRGAFHCPRLLAGARIAVLDDVMTTGATLNEVAATLKRAGAARVVNWVVARTLPSHV
ncbi:MAG TPA: ComF family protein [Burkholderiales bacterium]|nr:ComF family protein [Burkholderiales bacterium]